MTATITSQITTIFVTRTQLQDVSMKQFLVVVDGQTIGGVTRVAVDATTEKFRARRHGKVIGQFNSQNLAVRALISAAIDFGSIK